MTEDFSDIKLHCTVLRQRQRQRLDCSKFVSACSLSVCLLASRKLHGETLLNFCSCCLAYGPRLFALWLRCNKLCTSGFVDDVIFSHHGPTDVSQKAECMTAQSVE